MEEIAERARGVINDASVTAAEAARAQALAGNDAKALGMLLAEQLVFVHSSGTVDSKASLLDKMAQGRIRYESVQLQPVKVQALGVDTWALWGTMNAHIVVSSMRRQVASSYVTVWVLDADGVVRLALHHGTPLTAA